MKRNYGASRIWKRKLDLVVGLGTMALAALVFFLTLSPGVFPGLSAALIATYTGIEPQIAPAHPLWGALVEWICGLAANSLAYRLNAFSALCGIACTGLLYLLRWFWWRINAWCEVVAMVSSFGISVFWLVLKKYGPATAQLSTHEQLLYTIAFTTACWVVTAFLAPLQTDRKTLIDFYRKVRPFGPGWEPVRRQVALSAEEIATVDHTNIPLALLGWVFGCAVIWSSLFAIGNYLYGRMTYAAVLGAVLVVSGLALIRVINRLWRK